MIPSTLLYAPSPIISNSLQVLKVIQKSCNSQEFLNAITGGASSILTVVITGCVRPGRHNLRILRKRISGMTIVIYSGISISSTFSAILTRILPAVIIGCGLSFNKAEPAKAFSLQTLISAVLINFFALHPLKAKALIRNTSLRSMTASSV